MVPLDENFKKSASSKMPPLTFPPFSLCHGLPHRHHFPVGFPPGVGRPPPLPPAPPTGAPCSLDHPTGNGPQPELKISPGRTCTFYTFLFQMSGWLQKLTLPFAAPGLLTARHRRSASARPGSRHQPADCKVRLQRV